MSEDAATLRKKIKALIVFRVVFVTLLLGSSFLFKGYEKLPHVNALSYLIISLYALTIIYSLLLGKIKNLVAFAYTQLLLDVIFEIMLIYITGGIDSWFSFTLILTIISSSIILNKRAGYITATCTSILYGVLINLQFYMLLPMMSGGITEEKDYIYNIFVHIISFYLVAYLGGYLSSRLEKTAKKLEEKDIDLRDLEFFNREVVESLPSGLFTTDTAGNVLIFNRAAEKITGIKKSSVIGHRIDTVLPFFKFPFTVGRREDTIIVNGDRKMIGLGISTLKGIDEGMRGFIGIFQDLTQLKKLETEMKRKEKMATIGEFSSNIAHEIRNPLASLKGSIEMLKEDTVGKGYKKKLMEIALKEMERLNRIITDFLTYSRPTPPELKRFELHSMLDETVELLKNVEQNKGGISIRKDYSGMLEVNADPQKMRQVFWNFGINAIEAMPEGGELIISTRNTDRIVGITFKDSGVGIDGKDIERIFYPFFTTKEHGTGLGLSIAYSIIEEHKGSINVNSSPGVGTTFEIILSKTDEKT
jgi:two-component system sensor histidine kinase PilS (NtrC family)